MKDKFFNPLFLGHGSPMNIILDNDYTKFLSEYASSIKKPDAVVVISAHWQTRGTFITGNDNPEQIYDFYGFPDQLYEVEYRPKGWNELAKNIANSNIGINLDNERGIDHAAWSVMKHMYPNQNIPLLEISLDFNKTEKEHFELGKKLGQFSKENILLIGSGNIVHNLREISFDMDEDPFDWAINADNLINEKVQNNLFADLINYKKTLPDYQKVIPTSEHFLPLLYTLGMKEEGKIVNSIFNVIQNGSISMRCFEIK